jgi:hypothetical protein
MSFVTPTVLVTTTGPEPSEVVAVAGFPARYCGATRVSYATDLRRFAVWCHEGKLTLFTVRRAQRKHSQRATAGWRREGRRCGLVH